MIFLSTLLILICQRTINKLINAALAVVSYAAVSHALSKIATVMLLCITVDQSLFHYDTVACALLASAFILDKSLCYYIFIELLYNDFFGN